jgi:hypothetical protein
MWLPRAELTIVKRARAMTDQMLFVTLREGAWGVWLGRGLLSTHPTRTEALGVAKAAAREAASRGVRSTLFVGDQEGNHKESVVEPTGDAT